MPSRARRTRKVSMSVVSDGRDSPVIGLHLPGDPQHELVVGRLQKEAFIPAAVHERVETHFARRSSPRRSEAPDWPGSDDLCHRRERVVGRRRGCRCLSLRLQLPHNRVQLVDAMLQLGHRGGSFSWPRADGRPAASAAHHQQPKNSGVARRAARAGAAGVNRKCRLLGRAVTSW